MQGKRRYKVLEEDLQEHETMFGGRIIGLIDRFGYDLLKSEDWDRKLVTKNVYYEYKRPINRGDQIILEGETNELDGNIYQVSVRVRNKHELSGYGCLTFKDIRRYRK